MNKMTREEAVRIILRERDDYAEDAENMRNFPDGEYARCCRDALDVALAALPSPDTELRERLRSVVAKHATVAGGHPEVDSLLDDLEPLLSDTASQGET